ncbi:phage major capsid protein [Rhizobium sp. BR 315]|uniref:phage major capsid protein n=1 Tax=Rhizobium sp. BR 315 TaxID=3040014 RepID=UPI003D33FDC5
MNIHHLKSDRANLMSEARAALSAGKSAEFETIGKKIEELDVRITQEERMASFDTAGTVARDSVAGQIGNYSLRAAIEGAANGNASGLEAEVSAELARNAPQTRGIRVPLALVLGLEKRDQNTGNAAGTISSKFGPLITRLKPVSKVVGMGATVIQSEGFAPLELPRHLIGSTAQWLAEGGNVTASDPTWDQLSLAPTTVASQVVLSRRLLKTNSIGVDQIIAADMNYVVSNALDVAALNGTGANNQPKGIWTEVAATPFGGTFISDTASNLISAIELADNGTGAFLLTSKLADTMRKVKDGMNRAIDIEDQLHGYAFDVTNQAGAATERLTYGVWSDLVIATWGSVDLLVNPYKFSSSGALELTAFLDANVGTRHGAASFAWANLASGS